MVMLTPMLEIGGRVALGEGLTLRPFAALGLTLSSNDRWTQSSRLLSAPAGSGSLVTSVPLDQPVARVSAGAQLYSDRMLDFRLQYDGGYGGRLTAHGGSAVVSLRF